MERFTFIIFLAVLAGCVDEPKNKHLYELNSGLDWVPQVKPADLKNYIPWNDAIDLMVSGKVESVLQLHSLAVELDLKDGNVLQTIEPNIDTVYIVIKECGSKCKNIQIGTE